MGTKITDKGFARIMRAINELKAKPHVEVGILGAAASKTYPNGSTVLQVAMANEFGTDRIPERAALRISGAELVPIISALGQQVLTQIALGRMTVSKGLDIIGMRAKSHVQHVIGSNLPPPNSPSTIARKGSDKTLIDSGQYRASIDYVKVGVA